MCVRRIRSPLNDDQQMLAGGLAALDRAAGDRRVVVDAREVRVRGVELRDRVAGEHAVQRPRRPEDRIAFRHRSDFVVGLELAAACRGTRSCSPSLVDGEAGLEQEPARTDRRPPAGR